MRPGRLLVRVPAALRRPLARVLAAALVAALVVPVPAALARPAPPPGAGSSSPAALPPPPGKTTLLSNARGGGPAAGASAEPSMSADGRFVAFTSVAANLVAGDANGAAEVFLLDRRSGAVRRVPVLGGGPVPAGGSAREPSISADGNVVAFTYTPPSGFAAVGGPVVLAWDRRSGDVELVSRRQGKGAAQQSRQPSTSADGRYVAYTSANPDIVPEDEAADDVFRFDRRTGKTVLVSIGPEGGQIAGAASGPSISGDGNLVAFLSDGGDTIVHESTGPGLQVYVRDVRRGVTTRVSATPDGGPANAASAAVAIASGGGYVAFQSAATNLVDGPGAGSPGLFRRDLGAGVTVMVSLSGEGQAADGSNGDPSITPDGSYVAFTSTASNLPVAAGSVRLAATTTGRSEVYVRDVTAAETVLVSVAVGGGAGGAQSLQPSIGGGGRYVAFASTSDALVRRDTNKAADVFLRDLPPNPVISPPALDLGARAVGTDSAPGAALLSNTGWSPLRVSGASIAGAQRADFRVVADGCAARTLRRGETCTVSVVFRPAAAGRRTATLRIADAYTGSPRTVRLTGSASQAKLVLDPPIGPPGTVVIVNGSGFPAGARVDLSWSLGITPSLDTTVADARGRFRVPVIVFHNDRVGPRDLLAASATGTDFPATSAPMLVTQPSVDPPSFVILRLIDLPLVLLIRG